MMRNTPAKKGGALCVLCLLLGAALLAACAPDVSGPMEPGVSAVGTSGGGASASLSERAGFEASGAEGISPQGEAASGASVFEAGTDSPADSENICHLPLAPGTGTEFPEADRAIALADGTVALHLDTRKFVLGTDDAIGYTIENTTGHSVYVVFAPRLERWTDDAWEWVPCSVGFCGMPDPVDETCSDSLPLEWFPGLTEGVYRLTYTLYDSDTTHLLSDELAFSACFSLTGENG